MLFLGDIAIPNEASIHCNHTHLQSDFVVANLEGLILKNSEKGSSSFKLYNDLSVINYLCKLNVKIVTLANNHTMDYPHSLQHTINLLSQHGIETCGAGNNITQASAPANYISDGLEYIFLAYGWEPIGCIGAESFRPGINPLYPDKLLQCIQKTRKIKPDAVIIILVHWNYEMELWPQPAHRQLSFAAIDAGASAIIGFHSHCVQGIEVYKGAPIAYCLGNWHIPSGYFFSGKLSFPDYCKRQLVFEWDPKKSAMNCHWFQFTNDNKIESISSGRLCDDSENNRLTPFYGMSHREYITWFKKNRKKNAFLPVYRNYTSYRINSCFDSWVKLRQKIIKGLVNLGLKGGPK